MTAILKQAALCSGRHREQHPPARAAGRRTASYCNKVLEERLLASLRIKLSILQLGQREAQHGGYTGQLLKLLAADVRGGEDERLAAARGHAVHQRRPRLTLRTQARSVSSLGGQSSSENPVQAPARSHANNQRSPCRTLRT